jgi:hypothetical protein
VLEGKKFSKIYGRDPEPEVVFKSELVSFKLGCGTRPHLIVVLIVLSIRA